MTHEERLKRQSPEGLLQLQRETGDRIIVADLVDLSPVVPSEFFRVNQRLGPQRAVKMIEVRRRAVVGGKHTMDSLDSFCRPYCALFPLTFFRLRQGRPPHPPTAFPQLVDSSSQRRSVAFQAAMPHS